MIKVLLALFVFIYPMLISMHVFLPLMVGVVTYFFMQGIEHKNKFMFWITLFYMINLEVNLSLPIFLIFVVSMLFYIVFYPLLTHFRECKVCKPILSVIIMDALYLSFLLLYDFIFQTKSIVLDDMFLLYSLVVDLLLVVIL